MSLVVEAHISINEKIKYLNLFSSVYGCKVNCCKIIDYYNRLVKTVHKCNRFILYEDIESDGLKVYSDCNKIMNFISRNTNTGVYILDCYFDEHKKCKLFISNNKSSTFVYDIWDYDLDKDNYYPIYHTIMDNILYYPDITYLTKVDDICMYKVNRTKYHIHVLKSLKANTIINSGTKPKVRFVDEFEIMARIGVNEAPIFNILFDTDKKFNKNSNQYKILCELRDKRINK